MTLAKLSGRSKTTQSSSVTTAASSNGTNVISTSVTRRSVIHSSSAIAPSAKIAASINARTIVLPASYSITAGPVASGSAASTAVTNWRSTAVFSGSPLGST